MFITVSAWNNGHFNASGAGYGIRVSKRDRGAVFEPSWNEVVIHAPTEHGFDPMTASLSASFWQDCTEIRSAEIGRWLIEHGHATWPKSHPPAFRLEQVGANRFALRAA
jgi:hypothetical protein